MAVFVQKDYSSTSQIELSQLVMSKIGNFELATLVTNPRIVGQRIEL